MNELCMIVWYEELDMRSCFMKKWWGYNYERESVE